MTAAAIPFFKMQGLGNDFVIIDARMADFRRDLPLLQNLANRRLGIGCDQLIVIEPSSNADCFMRIYNADGSEAGACGNATRCVADYMMRDAGNEAVQIETRAGQLPCWRDGDFTITVDMGMPGLAWRDIPLAYERDTLHLGIAAGPFSDPVGVGMGNPHAVFFTTEVEKLGIEQYGPSLETHPLFPDRANIEFAEILSPCKIRMHVWERGAGITRACGSGACATAVAAIRRGLTGRRIEIVMDGGSLWIEWRESDGHVLMTGGYETVFEGRYFL